MGPALGETHLLVSQWQDGLRQGILVRGERRWFCNGEEGEVRRWFWNGDDGEERFPCLSVANRWAPHLVGPMCQCLNGRMCYVKGSSSEERGGGFAMEKRERRDGGF